MFNRKNKKDKGKMSQEARRNISQALRGRARGIRKAAGNLNTVKGAKKDAKNLLSKGLEKTGGGLGYVAGLASSTKAPTKQERKKTQNNLEKFEKSKVGKAVQGASKKAFDASNPGTRLKTLGSIYGGAAKGQEDRKKLANKKNKFMGK